jgi:hypothetical protein
LGRRIIGEVSIPDLPAVAHDPVIEMYKKDVDRTLIREMLRLTPEERILKLQDFVAFAIELREAGRRART